MATPGNGIIDGLPPIDVGNSWVFRTSWMCRAYRALRGLFLAI